MREFCNIYLDCLGWRTFEKIGNSYVLDLPNLPAENLAVTMLKSKIEKDIKITYQHLGQPPMTCSSVSIGYAANTHRILFTP